jgi:hypothetical protein
MSPVTVSIRKDQIRGPMLEETWSTDSMEPYAGINSNLTLSPSYFKVSPHNAIKHLASEKS